MKRLTELGHNHKAACRLRIEGKDNATIAEALNVSKRTLELWFSDDLIKAYLQQLAENVEQEFAVNLARGGMIAIRELTDLVQKDLVEYHVVDGEVREMPVAPTVTQKLTAINQLLDRLPGTASNRDRAEMVAAQNSGKDGGGGDTTNNILTLIQGADNHELADIVRGPLEKMLGSGSSNGSAA